MTWQPGTYLNGKEYQIESVLSTVGGFGITFKAKTSYGETVVIKAPQPHRRSEPNYGKFLTSFVKEAQNLVQASKKRIHPNIINVKALFHEGDVPCLVMNYAEGETLDDRVIRSGAIPEETLVPWIVTLAQALDHVHELGLIHRDANPANIIITLDNEPILIDLLNRFSLMMKLRYADRPNSIFTVSQQLFTMPLQEESVQWVHNLYALPTLPASLSHEVEY